VDRGRPHHVRLAPARQFRPARGRSERGGAPGGRSHLRRPDQLARVRLARFDRQPAVRRVPQPLGSDPHPGRVDGRRRRPGAAGRWRSAGRAGSIRIPASFADSSA
jgi:hypothetical protein